MSLNYSILAHIFHILLIAFALHTQSQRGPLFFDVLKFLVIQACMYVHIHPWASYVLVRQSTTTCVRNNMFHLKYWKLQHSTEVVHVVQLVTHWCLVPECIGLYRFGQVSIFHLCSLQGPRVFKGISTGK